MKRIKYSNLVLILFLVIFSGLATFSVMAQAGCRDLNCPQDRGTIGFCGEDEPVYYTQGQMDDACSPSCDDGCSVENFEAKCSKTRSYGSIQQKVDSERIDELPYTFERLQQGAFCEADVCCGFCCSWECLNDGGGWECAGYKPGGPTNQRGLYVDTRYTMEELPFDNNGCSNPEDALPVNSGCGYGEGFWSEPRCIEVDCDYECDCPPDPPDPPDPF
jgi:hypothetical protein